MKKLLFITTWDFTDGPSVGITKKIKAQIKAFQNNGFDVTYTYISNNVFYVCENNHPMALGKVGKLRKLIANYYLYLYTQNKKYPFVYSRYGLADLFYLKVLKQLKFQRIHMMRNVYQVSNGGCYMHWTSYGEIRCIHMFIESRHIPATR